MNTNVSDPITITPKNESPQDHEMIALMKRGGRAHQRYNARDMRSLVSFWASNDREQTTFVRKAI